MSLYRAPLPLAASGQQDTIDQAATQYDLARIQSGLQRRRLLTDSGFQQTANGGLTIDRSNPFGNYQTVTDNAERQSDAHGFGFSGRMMQLAAERPRYEARRNALRSLDDLAVNDTGADFNYQNATQAANRNAAAWGVSNQAFNNPTAAQVARRRALMGR